MRLGSSLAGALLLALANASLQPAHIRLEVDFSRIQTLRHRSIGRRQGNRRNTVSRRDKVLRGPTGRENATTRLSQDCAALHPALFSTPPCREGSSSRRLHPRSEERRVGKECRSRWSPYH